MMVYTAAIKGLQVVKESLRAVWGRKIEKVMEIFVQFER